jgi:hypothetical protein
MVGDRPDRPAAESQTHIAIAAVKPMSGNIKNKIIFLLTIHLDFAFNSWLRSDRG